MPEGHAVHAAAVVLLLYMPAGQSLQVVWPETSWYCMLWCNQYGCAIEREGKSEMANNTPVHALLQNKTNPFRTFPVPHAVQVSVSSTFV